MRAALQIWRLHLHHCRTATTSRPTKVLLARLLSNKSRVRNVRVRAVGVMGIRAAFTVISIYYAVISI